LIVVFSGPGGIPVLSVYRLDAPTAASQSQLIVINGSDAPSVDVASENGSLPVVSGSSAQLMLAPGSTAGLSDVLGVQAVPEAKRAGVIYLQIAVGSVANGTYRVINQTIDLNALTVPVQ
jgi:hypothetical protein